MQKIKAGFPLYVCSYILLVCISNFLPNDLLAQNDPKGLPFITNYRYQDYNADGINWAAIEDNKGVMYFTNGKGLLMYDGQSWQVLREVEPKKPGKRTRRNNLCRNGPGRGWLLSYR
jgi:hypothetical protein